MSVKIITDTAADFTPAEAQALGVSMAPMKVMYWAGLTRSLNCPMQLQAKDTGAAADTS